MNSKIALLIVYNHRYDKNIPRLDALYADSFTYIYHIVPFYDGNHPNVIPVYASSFFFQSYISQAYTHLKNKGFTHYFIIADDMLLNPIINENSLWEATGLAHDECFMPNFIPLCDAPPKWFWMPNAIEYRIHQKGLEVSNILPTREEAHEIMSARNIKIGPLSKDSFRHILWNMSHWKENPRKQFRLLLKGFIDLDYPMVMGYSDIYLITEKYMEKFCTYCGAFAAGGLFVEIATPTALALTSAPTKHQRDLKLKGGAIWNGEEIQKLQTQHHHSLLNLKNNFPGDKMYIHPIKLSHWN